MSRQEAGLFYEANRNRDYLSQLFLTILRDFLAMSGHPLYIDGHNTWLLYLPILFLRLLPRGMSHCLKKIKWILKNFSRRVKMKWILFPSFHWMSLILKAWMVLRFPLKFHCYPFEIRYFFPASFCQSRLVVTRVFGLWTTLISLTNWSASLRKKTVTLKTRRKKTWKMSALSRKL